MQGFNNGYNYQNGATQNNGYNFGNQAYGTQQNGTQYGLSPQQIVQYYQQGRLVWTDFVHGRVGADAYQLPPGVNRAILMDDEADRIYNKGYDNNGRPRVVDDNDLVPHVDPEPVAQQPIDLSPYATKDDIKSMIAEAFRNIQMPNMNEYVTQDRLNNLLSNIPVPNMASYVTQDQLSQRLGNLSVGNGGRIVSINEQNG